MGLTENIRAKFFWLLDDLKGNSVRSHYMDIKDIFKDPLSGYSMLMRQKYLNSVLKHAVNTVPYYKNLKDFSFVEDFPVINKNIIRSNQNLLISSFYNSKKLKKVTTSGSTGAPLTIWQDKVKRHRHNAENIFFSEKAGYKLGTRLYYLRVWNEINRKSFITCWLQNLVMLEAGNLSDNKIESFIKKIEKDKHDKSILAFSSTFEAIALYLMKTSRKINTKVNCLITISESLPEGARKILKDTFQCPVISRYSNMENGFLAQQCGNESGEYHINVSGFHIELLHPDYDKPVKEGEPGRVVVTDLFNYAMPLIRYDTGDIAVRSETSYCGMAGPVFMSIEGRRVDFIYDIYGNLLSPHVITNTMWRYSGEIKQFQFIQNGEAEYLLKLNPVKSSFNNEGKIIDDLKEFLGSSAKISLEKVNEIPLLASGKRKKIINNCVRD